MPCVFVFWAYSKNVQINDAHVMATNHKYALDTFSISEQDGLAIIDEERINSIVKTLTKSLTEPDFKINNNRRIARQIKQFTVQTQVSFVTSDNNDYTLSGAVVHIGFTSGSTTRGHYIYYQFINNTIMKYNDKIVSTVNDDVSSEINTRAVLLLYQKVGSIKTFTGNVFDFKKI